MRRPAAMAAGLLALHIGSAAAGPCPAGMAARAQVELYFGRNIGEVIGVADEAWTKFLDEEITPRFPDGLSVIDVAGQWKDPASGRIVREPGKQLILITVLTDAVRSRIAEIVALYKQRHQQIAVLQTEREVCARE